MADWPQALFQVKEASKQVETAEDKRLARRHGAPLFLVQLLLTAGLGAAVAGFVLKCALSAFRHLATSFCMAPGLICSRIFGGWPNPPPT